MLHFLRKAVLAALLTLATASGSCGGDVTAPKPVPDAMSDVTGTTPQSAVAGTAVATPPAVRVTAQGQGVAGVTVDFYITAGGGSIVGASPVTNANGIATVTSWTLGAAAGLNQLTARSGTLAAVTFSATGGVGPAAQLVRGSPEQQDAKAGAAVPIAPSVNVKDANGNDVTGVIVTFAVTSGGGSVTTTSVATNAAGIATAGTWTLGTRAGANTLTATVLGAPPMTFSALGTPGPAASIVLPQAELTGVAGTTFQLAPAVLDQYGNVIAGAPLTYTSAQVLIAAVSASGLVTAVATGTTTISVYSGTVSATIGVNTLGHPSGLVTSTLPSVIGHPYAIRIFGNTLVVTQVTNSMMTFVDLKTNARSTAGTNYYSGDLVFERSGANLLVSDYMFGTIQRVSVPTGNVLWTMPVGASTFRLQLSADDSRLYVSGLSLLYVINPATRAVVKAAVLGPNGTVVQGIALNRDESAVYVASTTGDVSRLDPGTLTASAVYKVGGNPQDVIVTNAGDEVFVANENGWVDILDGTTLAPIKRIVVPYAFGLAISPDQEQVYVTSSATGTVTVIDRATRAVLRSISVGSYPRRIAFSTSGGTAYVSNEGGWITVIR